jgi:hypothetical protein
MSGLTRCPRVGGPVSDRDKRVLLKRLQVFESITLSATAQLGHDEGNVQRNAVPFAAVDKDAAGAVAPRRVGGQPDNVKKQRDS